MNQTLRIAAGLLLATAILPAPAPCQVFDPASVVKPATDPGADAPTVEHTAWKWDFGGGKDKLYTGMKYTTKLTVENTCKSDQTVSIFINGLKELTLPEVVGCQLGYEEKSCAVNVPPGTKEVAARIESDPKFYYEDPLAPWATPRPFERINGTVVLFHAEADECLPKRDEYQVNLDLHYLEGAIPPPPPGPEKIVGAGPCQVWWNTGQRPAMLKPEQRCEAEIRPLAIGYRERILAPHVEKNPADWTWLPSAEQMRHMSSEELVAMKLRAEALINR